MSELRVGNLFCGYRKGKDVLRGVSLSVRQGEIVGLVGLNGSGKTTLIRCICGELRPRGEIVAGGTDLSRRVSARRLASLIGYIPQSSGFSCTVSAAEVVAMGFNHLLPLFADPSPSQRAEAAKALEKVGLGGREGENFLSLSGGERQLCLLARALVQKSAFLVLDEPDSSLDVKNKVAVLSALRQSAAREGRGVLIAMHDVSSALRFCDRIALLQDGKILSCFSPRECSEEEISLTLSRVYGTIAVSEMTLNGERCYAVAVGEA